jgi:hypothetical protein
MAQCPALTAQFCANVRRSYFHVILSIDLKSGIWKTVTGEGCCKKELAFIEPLSISVCADPGTWFSNNANKLSVELMDGEYIRRPNHGGNTLARCRCPRSDRQSIDTPNEHCHT